MERADSLNVAIFMPTIGRDSLQAALGSLQRDNIPIVINKDKIGVIPKIQKFLQETDAEWFFSVDDDALFAPNWIKKLIETAQSYENVGMVSSAMILKGNEQIARVQSSKYWSFGYSNRYKVNDSVIVCNPGQANGTALYRVSLLKEILKEHSKDCEMVWESIVQTEMIKRGYFVLQAPDTFFYHQTRPTLKSMMRQAYRGGVGRMTFAKKYKKFKLLDTILPLMMLLTLIPFLVEFLFFSFHYDSFQCGKIHTLGHIAYSFGVLVGIFKSQVQW